MVSRFYHTDLETCRLIPLDQLQVFMSCIEAIQAHESLNMIQNLQLGGGFVDKKDFRKATKSLEMKQKELFVDFGKNDSLAAKSAKYRNIIDSFQSGLPIGHLVSPSDQKTLGYV